MAAVRLDLDPNVAAPASARISAAADTFLAAKAVVLGASQKIQKRAKSLLTLKAGGDYIRPTTRAARRWRH